MRHIFDKLLELLPVIGLAAFGGMTRTLAGKSRGEPYRLRIAIPEIVIAVFSGLLIHWLTLETGMSDNIRTAAIALAGYSGAFGHCDSERGIFEPHQEKHERLLMMKRSICILAAAVGLLLAAGCSSMVKDMTVATGEKNVNASGYLVYGKLTTALDPVTGTPAPSGT